MILLNALHESHVQLLQLVLSGYGPGGLLLHPLLWNGGYLVLLLGHYLLNLV